MSELTKLLNLLRAAGIDVTRMGVAELQLARKLILEDSEMILARGINKGMPVLEILSEFSDVKRTALRGRVELGIAVVVSKA
jgi:hypothetical protein